MAGKIIADTIETGAGADISTSYVVNGSAKSWCDWNNTGTPAVDNSFNVSSLTDTATGKTGLNLVSSMSSANYAQGGAGANGYSLQNDTTNPRTSSRYTVITWYGSYADLSIVTALAHGDLA